MPPDNVTPEFGELVRKVSEARDSIREDDKGVLGKVERYGKAAWFLGLCIVGITVWVIKVQTELSELHREADENRKLIGEVRADDSEARDYVHRRLWEEEWIKSHGKTP